MGDTVKFVVVVIRSDGEALIHVLVELLVA